MSEAAVTTGAVVWDGAVVAARFFEQNRDYMADRLLAKQKHARLKVLELGAGCCGLVGLVAATLGCDAVVTDCPPAVLDALAKTVAANPVMAATARAAGAAGAASADAALAAAATDPCHEDGGSIAVKELDWTAWPEWFTNGVANTNDGGSVGGGGDGGAAVPAAAHGLGCTRPPKVQSRFDLVVCADCVYDVQLVPSLLQTASACLAEGGLVLATVDTAVHRPEALKSFASHAAELFRSVELVEPNTAPLRKWEQHGVDGHPDSDTVKIFLFGEPK